MDPVLTCPLSFAQERLWFLQRLYPRSSSYTEVSVLTLRGPLQTRALQSAIDRLIARHEVLRTTLAIEQGRPVQRVWQTLHVPLIVHEFSDTEPASREAQLRRFVAEEARMPFDFECGPLLRFHALRWSADFWSLVMPIHHIVCDGFAQSILFADLGRAYACEVVGDLPSWVDLPVQYGDYAVWQREELASGALDHHLDFWRRQLAGELPRLRLPMRDRAGLTRTFEGDKRRVSISAEQVKRITEHAAKQGATLFMSLLTFFFVVLRRYCGQSDAVVGTPVVQRSRLEFEPLVGLFVNTLILRVELQGDPEFKELLSRVRSTCLAAYANQDVPFERLVSELAPERQVGENPLVQVEFTLHRHRRELAAWGEVQPAITPIDAGTTRFDMSWGCWPSDSGIEVEVEYDRSVFEPHLVAAMLRSFVGVAAVALELPTTRVSEFDVVAPEDRELLENWSRIPDWNTNASIWRSFERVALRTPDRVAIESRSETVTYRQLLAAASRAAHWLETLDLPPGSLVALCVKRTPTLAALMLGTLRARLAYVPVDPTTPLGRIEAVLSAARPRLIIASVDLDTAALERLARLGRVITVGKSCAELGTPGELRRSEPHEGDLAYVVYTSGSTGQPKGVMVQHGALASVVAALQLKPGFREGEIFAALTTISFDIAAAEFLVPLTCGGRVLLVESPPTELAAFLTEWAGRSDLSVVQGTPSLWRLLLRTGWSPPASLRIWCGGEALDADLAEALKQRGCEVWNVYGPSEATIWASAARITEAITLGQPLGAASIKLLDERAERVPVGASGEIVIGGPCVALGYVNSPALTASSFIPDPTSERPGARCYRTGDRARYSADGDLLFEGRRDDQVKIRGHRIELREVASHIQRRCGIQDCVVTIVPDGNGELQLVVYLVGSATAAELRASLQSVLPDAMIPIAVAPLEKMPLLPNGKVDRALLPTLATPDPDRAQPIPDEPILGEHAKVVLDVWRDVLGIRTARLDDDFFAQGGHSLLAAELVWRINDVTGVEPPLMLLFTHKTPRSLVHYLESGAAGGLYGK